SAPPSALCPQRGQKLPPGRVRSKAPAGRRPRPFLPTAGQRRRAGRRRRHPIGGGGRLAGRDGDAEMTSSPGRIRDSTSLRTYPGRFLILSVVGSGVVLLVCGTLAVYLEQEQSRTASVLSENIGSRRAAADMEEA